MLRDSILCSWCSFAGYCYLRGQNIRYSPQQLAQLAIVGILLLMGGNSNSRLRRRVRALRTGSLAGRGDPSLVAGG